MAYAHPHVEAANKYARDIVGKKIVACKWVRLACKRHLDDLKKAASPRFPYRFDEKAAEKVCRFIELLPHTKGIWARKKELLKLEPWQSFKTCAIFGWLRKQDGLRRFRRVFIEEPRKNAKSTWAAAVGLYMFSADGEFGAEVYSGATTEKQAWEVFKPARLMALRTSSFLKHYGITVNASNIHILANGNKFEPMIGKPGDGSSPSCSIIDEYHEHETDQQVDAMHTGMGSREQPLLLIITTAGDNLAGPCYSLLQESQKMLQGVFADEELFALIYTVDEKVDWTSEKALRMANPNFDISVRADFLKSQQRLAKNNPRKAGIFKTKHLNMWVQARAAYFNTQRWIESETKVSLDEFEGQPCRLGMDLSSKVDIAALELLFDLEQCDCDAARRLEKKGFQFVRFGKYFLPEATIEAEENEHYRGWVDQGLITQTDGEMIDYVEIREAIYEIDERFQLEEVAYDPHQALMMVSELMERGVSCVEVRPLVLNFSEPMKETDGLIRGRKIAHDGDPVFTWMLSNVVAKEDKKDNVYPNKDRAQNKIDGPVAHLMAKARFMSGETSRSVYEERGILELEVEDA